MHLGVSTQIWIRVQVGDINIEYLENLHRGDKNHKILGSLNVLIEPVC